MKHIFLFTGESKTGKTTLARITNADETTTVIHEFSVEKKIGFEQQIKDALKLAESYNDKCKNIIIDCTELTARIFELVYTENKSMQENYMLSILSFKRVGEINEIY